MVTQSLMDQEPEMDAGRAREVALREVKERRRKAQLVDEGVGASAAGPPIKITGKSSLADLEKVLGLKRASDL